MRHPARIIIVLACAAPLAITAPALAQWSTDPSVNTAVCTTPTQPSNVSLVSDGKGGAVIGWVDFDPLTGEYDIRAQRISAAGTAQWGPAGVPVCTIPGVIQFQLRMASDAAGGAILAWTDQRDGRVNVYAQRIDAEGASHWATDGVAIFASDNQQVISSIVADGAGGAIVSWQDGRVPGINSPYAQRINHDGAGLWTPGGVLLASGTSENIEIAADGLGGACFAWHRYVAGTFDIVTQRLNAVGAPLWGVAGATACNEPHNQLRPRPVSDGSGGVILVWEDYRASTYSNVYAQRVGAAGAPLWAANGVPAAPNDLDQRDPRILGDGAGGATVVWSYTTGYGIGAQHFDAAGARQWTIGGAQVASAAAHSWNPAIASDGAGGAIVCWCDDRSTSFGFDVFAQRLNPAGAVQWTTNGVGVCTNTASQLPAYVIADGNGGAIACWIDSRNAATNDNDLYAQRIRSSGAMGPTLGVDDLPNGAEPVALAPSFPNPCSGSVRIAWRLAERADVSLELFDAQGRQVATVASGVFEAGPQTRACDTSNLPAGVYQYRLRAGTHSISRRMVVTR